MRGLNEREDFFMGSILFVLLPALLAGLVQGITGFGSGIVLMIFLPLQFSILTSGAIAGVIGLVLCIAMVIRYRESINYKEIFYPAILFLLATNAAVSYAKHLNADVMSLILGLFLFGLSIYYLFFNKNQYKPNRMVSFIFIITSGIFNGLFNIGGPLMVIYFLSKIEDKEQYLGTIQAFFTVITIFSTFIRISNGLLSSNHLLPIGIGIIGILTGLFFANRIVDRLDTENIQKLTYIVIGFSGIYNVIMAIT